MVQSIRESGRQECDSRDSRRVAAMCDGRMPNFVSRASAMRSAPRAVVACVAVADCPVVAERALAVCSDLSAAVAEHAPVVCFDLSVAAVGRVPVACSGLSVVAEHALAACSDPSAVAYPDLSVAFVEHAAVACPDLSAVQDGLAYCPADPAVRVPEQEFRGPEPKLLRR